MQLDQKKILSFTQIQIDLTLVEYFISNYIVC